MISLCMIVRNEENNLRSCLSQISPYVDEIILVDTGSDDKTKEIGREFTNYVYDFPWENDFSKARNFSISKANFDWILVLDADEVVKNIDKNNLNNFIKNPSNIEEVGSINIINVTNDEFGEKNISSYLNRLFNKNYYSFNGTIHEQLISKNGKSIQSLDTGIVCLHSGYTREALKKFDKIGRNLSLLKEALKDNIHDPYILYQIGKTHMLNGNDDKAIDAFERALSQNPSKEFEYTIDLIISLGYCYINQKYYEKSMFLVEYEKEFGHVADYYFVLGLALMNNGHFKDAAECFVHCTSFKSSVVQGITTFRAYYNIGVIFEALGFVNEAIEYYNMCSTYEPANKRLSEIYNIA